MVGGAMSGYCAIGSVVSAITPTSVMTMLITPAKMGRSMKKCGRFMPTAVAAAPSFSVLRLRDTLLGIGGTGRRFLGYGRDFHSGLQQLQTGRDHFLPILQPALHNPLSFEHASGLEIAALDCVIGLYEKGVFQSLL